MILEGITERIIGCVFRVHSELGPGFLEQIYRRALVFELREAGLGFETEREVPVYYRGQEVGRHRLDLLVERRVIVELKTVDALAWIHYAQARSYLRATGCKVALLINFNTERADCRRISGNNRHHHHKSPPIAPIPPSPAVHRRGQSTP